MANDPSSTTPPAPVERAPPEGAAAGRSWILERLDALLAEPLRHGTSQDLLRGRIVVAAACFLSLFNGIFVGRSLLTGLPPLASVLAGCGYLTTLALARWGRTSTASAMALLVTMSGGLLGSIFANPKPTAGEHAINTLLPLLAVFLVGARLGLLITLLLISALSLVHPYFRQQIGIDTSAFTPSTIWFGHIFAGVSYLGAWALGSLHSTARDAAQSSLERTLRELRDSESKLSSVLESTDDVVVSLDAKGRLLTANSAARETFFRATGMPLAASVPLLDQGRPEWIQAWQARRLQVLAGERLHFEESISLEEGPRVMDIRVHPILGELGQVVGMTIFGRDITSRREAETRLGEMHRTLVDVSRQAGMAEVATGVLHNVGNTLNSVNISTSLVIDRLRKSRVTSLARVASLLRDHLTDLPAFIARDERGQKLPPYLIALSEQLQEERASMLQEMHDLGCSVEHINSIVSMQQRHARAAGAVEQVVVPRLIDEALRLNATSFEETRIHVESDYARVPPIVVDRHKLLQILINLLSNARHALESSPKPDKRLIIRVHPSREAGYLRIEVSDNGIGIAPEHLGRMFSQGFTTKKKGHGFGLHISALAAEELKGQLTCTSPGLAQGATFALELPVGGEGFASSGGSGSRAALVDGSRTSPERE